MFIFNPNWIILVDPDLITNIVDFKNLVIMLPPNQYLVPHPFIIFQYWKQIVIHEPAYVAPHLISPLLRGGGLVIPTKVWRLLFI